MELTDLSDEDLVLLATAGISCGEEGHDENACLSCQAWALYESHGSPNLS